jgi:hypothetical protein
MLPTSLTPLHPLLLLVTTYIHLTPLGAGILQHMINFELLYIPPLMMLPSAGHVGSYQMNLDMQGVWKLSVIINQG